MTITVYALDCGCMERPTNPDRGDDDRLMDDEDFVGWLEERREEDLRTHLDRELLGLDDGPAQESVLADISGLVGDGRIDEAMDRLFSFVDDRLGAGQFSNVDALLARIPVETWDGALLVGVLTITASARLELQNRSGFVRATRARLSALGVAPEEVQETLQGLEEV